ncbi:MAG: carboxymuconolactone decarboxylase family protein, partial [Mucilaginibacter sp.]
PNENLKSTHLDIDSELFHTDAMIYGVQNSLSKTIDAINFSPDVSEKLKALLSIAASVQKGGKYVTPEQIAIAKGLGATDKDIHDTVLIAAAFCMFNRYVDGLASNTPSDLSSYPLRAQQIVEKGYGNHIFSNKQPVSENHEVK